MFFKLRINNDEKLARYMVGEESLLLNQGQLKGDVFVPTFCIKHRRWETSVNRFAARSIEHMLSLGRKWAKRFRRKLKFVGLAEVTAGEVRGVSALELSSAQDFSNQDHLDIVNWDSSEVRHRVQAELVARKARFRRAT